MPKILNNRWDANVLVEVLSDKGVNKAKNVETTREKPRDNTIKSKLKGSSRHKKRVQNRIKTRNRQL